MADPNPDDGLVPEIAELYKRNLGGWEAEARRRTEREASGERLLELERGLDGAVQGAADEKHETEQLDRNEAGRSEEGRTSRKDCKFDAGDENQTHQPSNSHSTEETTDSTEEREFKRRKR